VACERRFVGPEEEDVLVTNDSDGVVPDGEAAAEDELSRLGDEASADAEFDAAELDAAAPGAAEDVADATGREPALAGVRAGSARAAARASAAKAGVTAGKGRATPTRASHGETKGNIFKRIARFLREVVAELRKVIWPTRNEMVTYSIVVILFLIFMIALTWGADFGFAKLVGLIFGE